MKFRVVCVCMILSAGVVSSAPAEEGNLDVWSVDPLVKVFRDAAFVDGTSAEDDAARGETATFQLVLKSRGRVEGLDITVSPFATNEGAVLLAPAKLRFVGYVKVDRPTQKPSSDQLRKPPADYPDVLLERGTIPMGAGCAQPVWITVNVPCDAAAGTYTARVSITARLKESEITRDLPLLLRVYPVTLDKSRLWVTNWFAMQWPHMTINPEPESEEYYALLRRYARNMAEHRQNVALISPLALTQFGVDAAGELTFDFSRFDRWVRIFQEEGVIGLIEGGHIGGRTGGWLSPFGAYIRLVRDGNIVSEQVAPDSEAAKTFYSRFFPALVEHLRQQGWLECYLQHLADEPTNLNVDSYRALAALVRDYAPGLRTVEANHFKDLAGAIDVWVPQLNYLHEDYPYYRNARRRGTKCGSTCVRLRNMPTALSSSP